MYILCPQGRAECSCIAYEHFAQQQQQRTGAIGDMLEPPKLREHQLCKRHASVRSAVFQFLLMILDKRLQQVAGEQGLNVCALEKEPHHAVLDAAVAKQRRGRRAAACRWRSASGLEGSSQALGIRPGVAERRDELFGL